MTRLTRFNTDERILRRTALRIGLQTAAGVAVTVLVLCAIAFVVVLREQHRSQDELIHTTIARADDVGDPPQGIWLTMAHGTAQSSTPGIPAGLPDQDELRQTEADHKAHVTDRHLGTTEYRVHTEPAADGAVQAALDLTSAHAQQARLIEAFLAAGALGLVIAAILGGWLGRRAVRPMAEALKLQRRFVADAGHELRTPLTLLSTRAQLIRRALRRGGNPAAAFMSDVDSLVRDTAQLSGILDDLLLAADPREQPRGEPVDLAALAGQVIEAARPAADERGVTVDLAPAAEPTAVTGSEAALRRALTALLDNAIRHARGEVAVNFAAARGNVVVEVADDGPGIDPAVLPTLFDRFATAPANRTSGGTRRYGLGLALVSEIAARHGGSIGVAATGPGGATFRLTVPRAKRQESSKNSPAC